MTKRFLSFEKIRELNRRYKTPKIRMTPAVKIALFALRIYLVVLVGLLVVKFIGLVK
jgi:hypothetical protein